MSGRNINIYLQEDLHKQLQPWIKERKVSKFIFDEEIIVVPLSSQELEIIRPHEIFIKQDKKNGLDGNSKILFNRLRNIEKDTRLGDYRIGVVSEEIMEEAAIKLKLVLDLE